MAGNDKLDDLRDKAADRQQAREALEHNIVETRERFRPQNLAKEAGQKVVSGAKQGGEVAADQIRSHPGKIASIAALAAIVAARKPLVRLWNRYRGQDEPDNKE